MVVLRVVPRKAAEPRQSPKQTDARQPDERDPKDPDVLHVKGKWDHALWADELIHEALEDPCEVEGNQLQDPQRQPPRKDAKASVRTSRAFGSFKRLRTMIRVFESPDGFPRGILEFFLDNPWCAGMVSKPET